jgi:hypothetical protein
MPHFFLAKATEKTPPTQPYWDRWNHRAYDDYCVKGGLDSVLYHLLFHDTVLKLFYLEIMNAIQMKRY